jgi:CheY-like chemotaxis protein
MPGRSVHVLLVEDDDVDAELIVRGFQQKDGQQIITVVGDGIEALERLRGQAGHPKPVQPYLIITDISLPRMNGIEFIRELRRDSKLRQSVIFVLTSSALEADKRAAYEQQIAGYLLKANVTTNFSLLWRLVKCYEKHIEFPP